MPRCYGAFRSTGGRWRCPFGYSTSNRSQTTGIVVSNSYGVAASVPRQHRSCSVRQYAKDLSPSPSRWAWSAETASNGTTVTSVVRMRAWGSPEPSSTIERSPGAGSGSSSTSYSHAALAVAVLSPRRTNATRSSARSGESPNDHAAGVPRSAACRAAPHSLACAVARSQNRSIRSACAGSSAVGSEPAESGTASTRASCQSEGAGVRDFVATADSVTSRPSMARLMNLPAPSSSTKGSPCPHSHSHLGPQRGSVPHDAPCSGQVW